MKKEWGLKEKAIFTVVMLVVYRLGVAIPIPYVDSVLFRQMTQDSVAGNIFTMMSVMGGALTTLGFLSLGVMPYITASIIMQLMKVGIPKIEEMNQTDEGRKKVAQISRYLTLPLATLQAVGIVVGAPSLFGFNVFTNDSFFAIATAVFTLVVGALVAMRIGEEITIRGISNGTSLLIFTSILVSIPPLFVNTWAKAAWVTTGGFILLLLLILALVTFIEKSEYRIPVIYTKSSMNTKVQSSKLPVKVSLSGVLPVIFAGSLVAMPQIIAQIYPKPWAVSLANVMTPGHWVYTVVFIGLVIAFTFFSIILVFDVKKIATDIRVQGGFINGIKPGEATMDYLMSIAVKMAVLCAVYLSVITLVTIYLFPLVGITQNSLGATSVIILSTVIVTVVSVIESELSMINHSGFLGVSTPNAHKTKKRKGFSFGRKPKKKALKGFLD